MKKEIWKNVVGYEGHYKVSNHGRIKSLRRIRESNGGTYITKEKILVPIIKTTGYIQATFHRNKKSEIVLVHRIVAKHFLPKPIKGRVQVNHKDGNGLNNYIENLEWCTPSENGLHSYRVLGNKPWSLGLWGKDHPTSKPVIQKDMQGNTIKIWDCGLDAVRGIGADSGGITHCCQGKIKNHMGYIWEYKK